MASLLPRNEHYDYINHVDSVCKDILVPYIRCIERQLLSQHNNVSYYRVPVVIQSIVSSYYCHHLEERLSLKHLFQKWPIKCMSNDHSLCQFDWSLCPSIERIKCILNHFQNYLHSSSNSNDAISPYVTYKYYQIDEILADIHHIHDAHPQNTIKFYISNSMPEHQNISKCAYTDTNDAEYRIKSVLLSINNEFIEHSLCKQQFESAVSHIVQNIENPFAVLNTLRSCTKKLRYDDIRYRTLDTQNPRVQERLLGYDGVLEFLSLIGFESNAIGTRLACQHRPSFDVINSAVAVIDSIDPRLRPAIPSMMNMDAHSAPIRSRRRAQVICCDKSVCRGHRSMSLSDGTSSMLLKKSETEYIDSEQQMVCISLDKEDDKRGIAGWFGHKYDKIKQKRKGIRFF